MSEPAISACPLCGVNIESTALQAHVAAELDELDRAASAALPMAINIQPVASIARQHVGNSILQLNRVHAEQEQQQQSLHRMNGVPHAESLCHGAVYTRYISALGERRSSAVYCADDAQHRHHHLAGTAFQSPAHPDCAHASSRAALAMQRDENVQKLTSSGTAVGHGTAQTCTQHQHRQAAGVQSAAQHRAGGSQRAQEQAHARSASGRGSLQQQERRRKPHRKPGLQRSSQVTISITTWMQT